MSKFDNSNFYATFPFTTSGFSDLRRHRTELAVQQLMASAGVSAPVIVVPDGPLSTDHVPTATAEPPAAPARPRNDVRIRRAVPPAAPARLLPLAAFVWGSRALPPQPRTRQDHALIWVTGGRLHLDFPRRHHRLRPGDLHYVPAGTAFAALPMQGAQGHVALLNPALAGSAAADLPPRGLAAHVGIDGPRLLALLGALAAADPASAAGRLADLAQCLNGLSPERPPAPEPAGPPQDRNLVERFMALAEARLAGGASLAELAVELRSSMAALDRACTAARGRRAIELIHDLRLERAASLLRQGRQTPAQIAEALGYSSQAHFTRAFVAATGRTPEVFRAQPC